MVRIPRPRGERRRAAARISARDLRGGLEEVVQRHTRQRKVEERVFKYFALFLLRIVFLEVLKSFEMCLL